MVNVLLYGVYVIAVLALVFFLPGYLIARFFLYRGRETEPFEVFVVSLATGIGVVPIVSFGMAMLVRTYISRLLVSSVSAAISAVFFLLLKRAAGKGGKPESPARGKRKSGRR